MLHVVLILYTLCYVHKIIENTCIQPNKSYFYKKKAIFEIYLIGSSQKRIIMDNCRIIVPQIEGIHGL